MKAQLALLEVFLATFAIAAGATAISAMAYTPSALEAGKQIAIGNAAYDFVTLTYQNRSAGDCLSNLTEECGGRITAEISTVYNLKGVELSVNGRTALSGAITGCGIAKEECLPVRQNMSFAVACVYLCDD